MLSALIMTVLTHVAAVPPPTDAFRLGGTVAGVGGFFPIALGGGGALAFTGAGRVDTFAYRFDVETGLFATTAGRVVRPAVSGVAGVMFDAEDVRIMLGGGPVVGLGFYDSVAGAPSVRLDAGAQLASAVSVPLSDIVVLDVALRLPLTYAGAGIAALFLPSLGVGVQFAVAP